MTIEIPEEYSYAFQRKVSEKAPMIVGGEGLNIVIEDPITKVRKIAIDAIGGAAVSATGHGDKEIIQAMKDAAELSFYSYPGNVSNYAAEELAKFICDNSPKDAFRSALFTSSGSEATENALKIIRQYFLEIGQPQRKKFIGRKQAYHGYTIGAFSVGDGYRRVPFKEIMMPPENTPKVSQCYPYRYLKAGESLEQYKDRLVQEVEDTFINSGPDTIAAVIFETVTGTTYGTGTPIPGYLDGVKKVCDKYGALFMLDEVMCGMGRCSGHGNGLHAWEQYMDINNGPDLQTIGKVLGSGFVSIAGVLISPKVYEAYIKGSNFIAGTQTYHSHSFNCKVAMAVQKKIKRDNLISNIYKWGNYLGDSLKSSTESIPIVGEVRGTGGFWSLEFVKNKETKEPFDRKLNFGARVRQKCLDNGVSVIGMHSTIDGVKGDHITLAPAYILDEKTSNQIVDIISKSISEVYSELSV